MTGPQFPQLHALFEEEYNELSGAVDEIAERIRTLGLEAPGSFEQFKELASIKEVPSVPNWQGMLTELAQDHEMLAKEAHSAFSSVEETGDEASADLLTNRMRIHEKAVWMLRASSEV